MNKLILVVCGLLCAVSVASADEASELVAVKKMLSSVMPNAQPDSLKSAPIPGMYEAVYGAQVIYVSKDGRYLLEGDLYDMQRRENISEKKREVGRAKVVNEMDPKGLIVFAPEQSKYTITAFTDIDCGYCQKLHREMKQYTDKGITIRYAAYPRAGVNTPSYQKAVNVWCASNRQEAMTKAKSGQELEKKDCDNPVKDHMKAAGLVGVTGTPTLVLGNGTVIPGYVPADRLIKILEGDAKI